MVIELFNSKNSKPLTIALSLSSILLPSILSPSLSVGQPEKEDRNQKLEQIGSHHLGAKRVCGEPEEQQSPVRDRSTASGTKSARLDLSFQERKHLSISADFNWHRYFHNFHNTVEINNTELASSSLQFIFPLTFEAPVYYPAPTDRYKFSHKNDDNVW